MCLFKNERLISFSYLIWFMISEKNITRPTFLHRGAWIHQISQQGIQKILSALKLIICGLVVFIDINKYILTEGGRSFKTFLKDNYAIALDSCVMYLLKNVKHEIEHDIDSIYGDVRHS